MDRTCLGRGARCEAAEIPGRGATQDLTYDVWGSGPSHQEGQHKGQSPPHAHRGQASRDMCVGIRQSVNMTGILLRPLEEGTRGVRADRIGLTHTLTAPPAVKSMFKKKGENGGPSRETGVGEARARCSTGSRWDDSLDALCGHKDSLCHHRTQTVRTPMPQFPCQLKGGNGVCPPPYTPSVWVRLSQEVQRAPSCPCSNRLCGQALPGWVGPCAAKATASLTAPASAWRSTSTGPFMTACVTRVTPQPGSSSGLCTGRSGSRSSSLTWGE